jgi:hypothetical protein
MGDHQHTLMGLDGAVDDRGSDYGLAGACGATRMMRLCPAATARSNSATTSC